MKNPYLYINIFIKFLKIFTVYTLNKLNKHLIYIKINIVQN